MKIGVLLLCGLCLLGCSSSNGGDGQDGGPQGVLRSKSPQPGQNVASTPRFQPTCQLRQHDATLRSSQLKPRRELHGRPRGISSLGPGDPYPNTAYTTLRRALALRLPKSPSAYQAGCADGTREGFLSLPAFPDVAACDGSYGLNEIGSPEANALCAPGWHVCSPAADAADAAIIGSLTYLEATLPDGCYAYNAAQDGGACIECTGQAGARDTAGVGKDCIGGTYDPAGSGCTADGRVDAHFGEDDTTYACGGSRADGVVCCSDGTGTGSTPDECPSFAPGQEDVSTVNDCTGFCRVGTGTCDEQNWPDGYPVHCSRDGYEWVCLEGAACDLTTPIDFYEMLYTPHVYCVFDPDTCPAEFPDSCGGVCCLSGATCVAGAHCQNACPPGYPAECQTDGLFSGCCLDQWLCGYGCRCPSMRSCGERDCCPDGQVCRDGTCHSRDCDPTGDYASSCQDFCCLWTNPGDCQTAPGVCSCPPDLPVECGDMCCSSGSTCDSGTCAPPCAGDYPVECLTASRDLLCCLDGATCGADGCSCPPDLPAECAEWCAEAGTQDLGGGDCLIPECGYGTPCGALCCDGVDCLQPGECGCPDGYPVPCDDSCCLDNCTCDPRDCTDGCGGDFPGFCATGWSGAECCPAGAECRDPGGCACPAGHPVDCDRTCCPAGTRCNGEDCVEAVCPDGYPLECGDYCCLEDAECLAGDQCSCVDSHPVECDLWCCPEGWSCGNPDPTGMRQCVKPTNPDGDCPGGWMGSTRSYGAVGTSDSCRAIGETNVCITREMYEQGTGLPFPPSCAPENTTGCINNAGVLVKPCCPGLTCYYRDRCGGPSNGQCKP